MSTSYAVMGIEVDPDDLENVIVENYEFSAYVVDGRAVIGYGVDDSSGFRSEPDWNGQRIRCQHFIKGLGIEPINGFGLYALLAHETSSQEAVQGSVRSV